MVEDEGVEVATIFPLKQSQQMKRDLHDLAVVAERRDEVPVTMEQMKQRLKKDGLL
jgi:hypothetical protein